MAMLNNQRVNVLKSRCWSEHLLVKVVVPSTKINRGQVVLSVLWESCRYQKLGHDNPQFTQVVCRIPKGPHTANQPLNRPHITRKLHYHICIYIYSYIYIYIHISFSKNGPTKVSPQQLFPNAPIRQSGWHQPRWTPLAQCLQAVVWIQQRCQTSSTTVSNLVMTWGMENGGLTTTNGDFSWWFNGLTMG